jgi:hypothetical protein
MKITVDAAMRARDVSRPRAEHEALATEKDATAAAPRKEPASSPEARPPGAPADADRAPRQEAPHRRRKRH